MVNTATLSKLSKLAKQLNSDSDSVNAAISAFSQQLREMNLGIALWVTIGVGGLKLDSDSQEKYRDVTLLGFCKLGDEWQLAINERTVTYDHGTDEEATEDSYQPLLKTSRDTRLNAIDHFDELLDALVSEAQNKLTKLERAKKIASSEKKGGK